MIAYTGERPTEEHGKDGSLLRYHSILHLCKNRNVLDLGCGIGVGTRYLFNNGIKVFGYDNNVEAIEEARRISPDISFYSSLLEYFLKRHKESSQDLIVMNEFIEHLETVELEHLLEIFKTDIVGTTPNGDTFVYHPKTISERIGFHIVHYTYNELVNLMSKYYKYVVVTGAIWDPVINKFTSLNFVCQDKIPLITSRAGIQ
jgi:2-polyprenyl-3-methyl-5-hydroxy-6-metoxy-1,4-benzoquinol methylase